MSDTVCALFCLLWFCFGYCVAAGKYNLPTESETMESTK